MPAPRTTDRRNPDRRMSARTLFEPAAQPVNTGHSMTPSMTNSTNLAAQNRRLPWLPCSALAVLFAACSGGGDSDSVKGTSGDFLVLRTTPPDNGKLFLNEPIRIDFSNKVDLRSADLNTISFQVFDLNGNALNERPAGSFSLGTSAGDESPGRQLVFTPRFPTNNSYTDGGFKPGRVYITQLVGGDRRNETTLLDQQGRGLAQPVSFRFQTADGTTPSQLFSDTKAGGPRRIDFTVRPMVGNVVPLNRFSTDPVEIELAFDQPLNPADTNVPVTVSADPLRRDISNRGRIFLEYDDQTTQGIWIPATVDLEVNAREGSKVVLRPIGILPNNADVRVIVENTVEDMSGESNVTDAAYDRIFATFRTTDSFTPQYDALVENFNQTSTINEDAAFLEPQAVRRNGKITASFNFDGGETRLSYRPTQREVILDTDFTQITPENSQPINVSGGVFSFSRVEIPEGVIVRGAGTNPMVWLCTGDFIVDGTLTVDGGDGQRVDSLNSANAPTPGGIGVCGGGNGGRGSPNSTDRSPTGQPGFGPGQRPGLGGEPGRLSCVASCNRGSAGGGGSFVTQGDPYYPLTRTGVTDWPQVDGEGGQGCLNRSLPGGAPGGRPFFDSRTDNDFWGQGVNVFRGVRITGELLAPIGGAGGGGGGDRGPRCNTGDPGFINDNKGGGGGGGAGILIVQALGQIKIGRRGLISANGGQGGGGEQAGGNNEGGGGGGASGGMIVLMTGQGLEIEVHGNENSTPTPRSTYGEGDFEFAISADGGIGTQGRFGGLEILNKYPFGSQSTWNQKPTGALGGLGLVQILVPPGDDQSDNTGNRLDDRIRFVFRDNNGTLQTVSPDRKRRLLGWRGWPDDVLGFRVDDNGNQVQLQIVQSGNYVNNPSGEGDIRPSPILLPSPFGAVSRAQSSWIDLGSAVRERRDQTPLRDDPRTVVALPGQEPRPDFSDFDAPSTPGDDQFGFKGTARNADYQGYIQFDQNGSQVIPEVQFPGGNSFEVEQVVADDYDGMPAHRVELSGGRGFAAEDNRYANYRWATTDASGNGIDFRILGHEVREGRTFVYLDPEQAYPSNNASGRVLAKFFAVTTENSPGLGSTYLVDPNDPSTRAPVANVRIGFAFHTDPSEGAGPNRWPNATNPAEAQFEYDLFNPAFQTWLQTRRPQFVQWDVVFNSRFSPLPGNDSGQPLTSEVPLPELDYVVLPYRF